jgi:hypothetical protein
MFVNNSAPSYIMPTTVELINKRLQNLLAALQAVYNWVTYLHLIREGYIQLDYLIAVVVVRWYNLYIGWRIWHCDQKV